MKNHTVVLESYIRIAVKSEDHDAHVAIIKTISNAWHDSPFGIKKAVEDFLVKTDKNIANSIIEASVKSDPFSNWIEINADSVKNIVNISIPAQVKIVIPSTITSNDLQLLLRPSNLEIETILGDTTRIRSRVIALLNDADIELSLDADTDILSADIEIV